MTKRDQFIAHLTQKYPGLSAVAGASSGDRTMNDMISDNMISDFQIELPTSVLQKIKSIVAGFYQLRTSKAYQQKLAPLQEKLGVQDRHHHSVMMSYDFHIMEAQQPRLVEVNTNAAFHILGLEMYEAAGQKQAWTDFSSESFREMILNEVAEANIQKKSAQLQVAIFDEKPSDQRLFIEFLVYQKLFQSFGWTADILDIEDLKKSSQYDFIYNRHTDFYFQTEQTKVLKELSYQGLSCVSPHAYEYLLLADKERMILWNQDHFFEELGLTNHEISELRKAIPRCVEITSRNADELWTNRKGFFMKPMRAFGAKQSYRGSSISRKAFDQLIDQEMIAQEYLQAPEVTQETPEGPQSYKYDLRAYVYKDQLQSIVARIYQGQVTNLRTPRGGFAPVIFT